MLYSAVLPKRWKMNPTNHSMYTEILDDTGNKRGSMFYKAAYYDRCANMVLIPRYNAHDCDVGDKTEVYFGDDNNKLFIEGYVDNTDNFFEDYKKVNELKFSATKKADELYPDWREVWAYWDGNSNLSNDSVKKIKK